MKDMVSNHIDLTITSPPYNCGKNYGTVSDNLPWDEYWENTRRWVRNLYRITKAAGRLAVVLPWWMGKKPRRDSAFEFQKIAQDEGWLKLDKIIWVKGNESNVHTSGGWGGGGSGWGTYMSPSGPSVRCASEPILIFCKEKRGRGVISGEGRGACVRGDMSKDEWMKWTLDTWFIQGGRHKFHPAVFPSEVPHRLVKLYTYPGDVILDPFMGTGTTGKECVNAGRKFIGIEIEQEYFDIAVQRIEKAQQAKGE
jgi:site-specific DNA-methyltransferase (adenine-specific)